MNGAGQSAHRQLEGLGAYFFMPFVLGFATGVHQAGLGRYFSIWGSIVVWVVHFVIFWACCLGAAYVVGLIARRLNLQLVRFPRLVLTAFLGAAIARPFYWIGYQLRMAYALQSDAHPSIPAVPLRIFEFSTDFLLLMFELYGPNVAIWSVCSLVLGRYVAIPFVSGDEPQEERAVAWAAQPRLQAADTSGAWMSRVKPKIGRDLRWLKSEGHYLRVCTDGGSDLIHYRLSDAVEQLAGQGLQVHRSYWVSQRALADEGTRLEGSTIRLGSDETIPVGPSYLMKVRETLGGSLARSEITKAR